MLRVIFWIFEFHNSAEERVVDWPATGFVLGALLTLHKQRGDVGQGSGATRGDAIGGEGVKGLAEDVVDVDVGDEIACGAGEFGGEVGLWRGSAMGVAKVGEAKAVAFGMGREGAAAAIGKLELTQCGDRSFVGHNGESVAKRIL